MAFISVCTDLVTRGHVLNTKLATCAAPAFSSMGRSNQPPHITSPHLFPAHTHFPPLSFCPHISWSSHVCQVKTWPLGPTNASTLLLLSMKTEGASLRRPFLQSQLRFPEFKLPYSIKLGKRAKKESNKQVRSERGIGHHSATRALLIPPAAGAFSLGLGQVCTTAIR